MMQRHLATRWLGVLGVVALLVASVSHGTVSAATPRQQGVSPRGHAYFELKAADGGRLRYALALPKGFERSRAYPVLLAFPPGPQTEQMVEAGFDRYWGDQASARGWIVVSPVAPDGQLFYRGGERLIPLLLDQIASEFQIESGRFHVAGWSNGGRSAFRVALDHPSRVRSLVVLPGGPPTEEDFGTLDRLAGIPVRMFAGGLDTAWVRRMQDTGERLKTLGIDVETTILPGEGHVPGSLDGDPIMDLMEGLRAQLARTAQPG